MILNGYNGYHTEIIESLSANDESVSKKLLTASAALASEPSSKVAAQFSVFSNAATEAVARRIQRVTDGFLSGIPPKTTTEVLQGF